MIMWTFLKLNEGGCVSQELFTLCTKPHVFCLLVSLLDLYEISVLGLSMNETHTFIACIIHHKLL